MRPYKSLFPYQSFASSYFREKMKKLQDSWKKPYDNVSLFSNIISKKKYHKQK